MSQKTDENIAKPGKYLHKIGESILINWLKQNYDIDVVKITSIPVGAIGDSYVVENLSGKKYFLKIYLTTKLRVGHPQGLSNTLELTSLFHDEGIENVPYPIKRRDGKLEGEFGEYYIILTNYINGNTPEITKDFVVKVAILIATIHQVDKNKVDLSSETFDSDYANELSKYLLDLEQGTNLNENQQKLKDLLLFHQSRLNRHIDRFNELCSKVRNNQNIFVITHGDLISDNLISDTSGNAFIVDWDAAKVASPERDIWFFMGEFGSGFLKTYKKYNQDSKIDIDLLSFYMYKRYIEDIVYWANEILYENLNNAQAEGNLDGIKVCCLDAFQDIEKKVENMRSVVNDLQ